MPGSGSPGAGQLSARLSYADHCLQASGGYDSGTTSPEMIACPEPSYAVHFQCFGPCPNGNAKNLAAPTATGCTWVVFPSGLVTAMRATEGAALPTATAGTPLVQSHMLVPSRETDVTSSQLLAADWSA